MPEAAMEEILMDYHPYDERKFQAYCAACATIENLLEEKISKSFESMGKAAEKFAKVTELSDSTAIRLLGEYRGTLVTKIPPGSRGNTEQYLERLAVLYELLDVGQNEEIVKLTQEVNPEFEYPL